MSSGAFRCGHPKATDNIRQSSTGPICRLCANAASREWKRRNREEIKNDAEARRIFNMQQRMRRLPDQIEATRHKLAMLENEARRYGMTELIGAA